MQKLMQAIKQRWYIQVRINGAIFEEFYENLYTENGWPDTSWIEKYLRRKYGTRKIITWIRGISRTIIFDLYL